MKKSIFIPLAAALLLGLAACSPSSSGTSSSDSTSESSAVYNTVTISNKTALEEDWVLGSGNRSLTITCDPTTNTTQAFIDGVLTSSSSDTSVVTVSNASLVAVGVGTATVTVTYGGKVSDTVTITVVKSSIYNTANDPWKAEEFAEILENEGNTETTYYTESYVYLTGVVTSSSYNSTYNSYNLYLEAGDYTVEVYSGQLAETITGVYSVPDALVGATIVAYGYVTDYVSSNNHTYEVAYATAHGVSPIISSIEFAADHFLLSAGSLSTNVGSSETLTATYVDTTVTTALSATSGDTTIATVSVSDIASGAATITVTGVAVGSTTVTVVSGTAGYTAKFDVSVAESGVLELTTSSLGITGGYGDYTGEIDGVSYYSYQCAEYGDGIQMRYRNSVASYFCNTTALPKAIASLVINFNSEKQSATADLLYVALGSSSVQEATEGTAANFDGTNYSVTITPTSTDATFFKVGHTTNNGAIYISSVQITFAD